MSLYEEPLPASAPVSDPVVDSRPTASDAWLRELRGTLLVALALGAILAAGWVGARLAGRELILITPRVFLLYGPGWGEARPGPRGLFSQARTIGRSNLGISVEDPGPPRSLLERYRSEVVMAAVPKASFDPPQPVQHPAGDAVGQTWTALGRDGTTYHAELLAVAGRDFVVVLDARWPTDESLVVIAEIRRVVRSLGIGEFGP